MPLTAKQFANQLNKVLNDMGVPVNNKERVSILSKMLAIPRQQAWTALEGYVLPPDIWLEKIINGLEMSADSSKR